MTRLPLCIGRVTAFLIAGLLMACGRAPASAKPYDTAITHARVLDVTNGQVADSRTILIRAGRIADVVADGAGAAAARSAVHTIDAAGRLVTPGLIDVHCHSGEIVGDALTMTPDSLAVYRRKLADAYLPWGVTTVRSCGDNERWIPMLKDWMRPAADAPDFYPCGAALVSPNDRNYSGHVTVSGADSARAKVRQYHDLGFRHLKVYWRLRDAEFGPAMDEARRLGMNVTGHVDFKILGIHRALELGLRQFEHAYTLGVDALDDSSYAYNNGQVFVDHYPGYIHDNQMPGSFFISRMEMFNSLGPANPALLKVIGDLKAHGAGVTPTLHVFAQRFRLSWHTTPSRKPGYDDTDTLADSALARCQAGYRNLQGYVKRMYDAGIPLTVGTDWAEPGKATLSELLLLHDCGLPMTAVFAAATVNGARAMGLADDTGTIAPGRKANLVIFDADPLTDPRNLLGRMTVVKDGVEQPVQSVSPNR